MNQRRRARFVIYNTERYIISTPYQALKKNEGINIYLSLPVQIDKKLDRKGKFTYSKRLYKRANGLSLIRYIQNNVENHPDDIYPISGEGNYTFSRFQIKLMRKCLRKLHKNKRRNKVERIQV